jgi:hypothetical protein
MKTGCRLKLQSTTGYVNSFCTKYKILAVTHLFSANPEILEKKLSKSGAFSKRRDILFREKNLAPKKVPDFS